MADSATSLDQSVHDGKVPMHESFIAEVMQQAWKNTTDAEKNRIEQNRRYAERIAAELAKVADAEATTSDKESGEKKPVDSVEELSDVVVEAAGAGKGGEYTLDESFCCCGKPMGIPCGTMDSQIHPEYYSNILYDTAIWVHGVFQYMNSELETGRFNQNLETLVTKSSDNVLSIKVAHPVLFDPLQFDLELHESVDLKSKFRLLGDPLQLSIPTDKLTAEQCEFAENRNVEEFLQTLSQPTIAINLLVMESSTCEQLTQIVLTHNRDINLWHLYLSAGGNQFIFQMVDGSLQRRDTPSSLPSPQVSPIVSVDTNFGGKLDLTSSETSGDC